MAQMSAQQGLVAHGHILNAGGVQAYARPTSIPLLADFRITSTSALISPNVVVGLLRLAEFLLLSSLGLAIGAVYLAPPKMALDHHYLLAIVEINLGNLQSASAAVNRLATDSHYRERSESLMDYIASESGAQ